MARTLALQTFVGVLRNLWLRASRGPDSRRNRVARAHL